MAKANITNTDGTKIIIEGTPEEVSKVVRALQGVSPLESEDIRMKEPAQGEAQQKMTDDPARILAAKCSVSPDVVIDYIHFEGEHIEILADITRRSNAESQLLYTLLVLTIRKIAFSVREIDSSVLREGVATKGIRSLVNLSTNIKKFPSLIAHKRGKRGKINTAYMLTTEGYSCGLTLLKRLFGGEQLSDLDLSFLKSAKIKRKGKKGAKANNTRKSGLNVEVEKMLGEGFFDQFRTVTEACTELRKRGFFNRRQDVDAVIRKSLMQSKGLLLREKQDRTWHYVKRK
ncbi:hypothetical protein ACFL96_09285 [Thermoproteota archaeon]